MEVSEERRVNAQGAVVVDEPEFAEAVHEIADPGAGGADHFGKGLLIDVAEDFGLGRAFVDAGDGEQSAGKTFLAGVKDLIDKFFFDAVDAAEQVGEEHPRAGGVLAKGAGDGGSRSAGDKGGPDGGGGGGADAVPGETLFAEEVAATQDAKDGFFLRGSGDGELDMAVANGEKGVGFVALGEDDLLVGVFAGDDGGRDFSEEIERVRSA